MREIDGTELAALKLRVTGLRESHCDFTDYPLVILSTDDGWIAESLKPALFRPHMRFDDRAELDRWLAELLSYAESEPDEELAPFLELQESPDFPQNLAPILRAAYSGLRHPLDFSEASVLELSDTFRDGPRYAPEEEITIAVTLYIGEAIRTAIAGRWRHEVNEYGHDLYLYQANGEDTDFLELAREQTQAEVPNLFQVYEGTVRASRFEWPQASYDPPREPVPIPEEAIRIDDAELARLKAEAVWASVAPVRSPVYPFVIYQLSGRLVIESLRPGPQRPHLCATMPSPLSDWIAATEGFIPAPRVPTPTTTEFWKLEEAIAAPGFPADLPDRIRREGDLTDLPLDFSTRSLGDLSDRLREEWPHLPAEAFRAVLTYTLEVLRQALHGQWEIVVSEEGRELHIRTAEGRLCDFAGYLTPLIYDDSLSPYSLYIELFERFR